MSTVVLQQALNAVLAIGVLYALAKRRRRRDGWQLGLLGCSFLALTAVTRLSGAVASAYGQERVANQASFVLVLCLGAMIEDWHGRLTAPLRQAFRLVLLALTFSLYAQPVGLTGRLIGGSPTANIANSGDAYDRFVSSDEDIAAGRWLGDHLVGAPIFTDKYGRLVVLAYSNTQQNSLFPDVTPGTLDARSYVLATSANIRTGAAWGASGRVESRYSFPLEFLDANKSVLYSTRDARVYR
jgi:hypothetical protein